MRKPSFFEKLTGSISPDSYDDLFDTDEDTEEEPQHESALASDETENIDHTTPLQHENSTEKSASSNIMHDMPITHTEEKDEEEQTGELSVDVYQTNDDIVVKALIAGIAPHNVDISLTRDTITIRGTREEHKETSEENYFHQELYWGSFSRTILLPEEVDVDEAEATTTHGILVIKLPKINKHRETKLKVKSR